MSWWMAASCAPVTNSLPWTLRKKVTIGSLGRKQSRHKQLKVFTLPEESSAAWLPARTTTSKNLTQSCEKTGRAVLLGSSLNEEVRYHRPMLGIGGPLVKLQADPWFAFGWCGQITRANVPPLLGVSSAELAADLVAFYQELQTDQGRVQRDHRYGTGFVPLRAPQNVALLSIH